MSRYESFAQVVCIIWALICNGVHPSDELNNEAFVHASISEDAVQMKKEDYTVIHLNYVNSTIIGNYKAF